VEDGSDGSAGDSGAGEPVELVEGGGGDALVDARLGWQRLEVVV